MTMPMEMPSAMANCFALPESHLFLLCRIRPRLCSSCFSILFLFFLPFECIVNKIDRCQCRWRSFLFLFFFLLECIINEINRDRWIEIDVNADGEVSSSSSFSPSNALSMTMTMAMAIFLWVFRVPLLFVTLPSPPSSSPSSPFFAYFHIHLKINYK